MSAVALPGLTLAGEPRAQLLPVSVREREKSRSARRLMVLLVVLALVAVGGGIFWAYLAQVRATSALDAANARTTEVLAEQATYAQASQLSELLSQTLAAQETAVSTEVQWWPLMSEVWQYLPADQSITGLVVQAPAPWEPSLIAEGPLREPRVATVTLELTGERFASVAAFVENIPSVYALADVKITGTDFEDGVYHTSVSLTFDADALSHRYPLPDGEGITVGDLTDAAAAATGDTTAGKDQ